MTTSAAAAMSALMSASTPREAVEQFVALMVDDPVRPRPAAGPRGGPVLVRSGGMMPTFIGLLQRERPPSAIRRRRTRWPPGWWGVTALFTAYLDGRLTASREQFIDSRVDLLLSRATR